MHSVTRTAVTAVMASGFASALFASHAGAALVLEGNHPQDDNNVLFQGFGTIDLGLTVIGAVQNDGILVSFTSADTMLQSVAQGQARIEAAAPATGFDDLLVDTVDPALTFAALIFKVEGETSGTLTISGNEADGGSFSDSFFVPANGGGSGFFTVIADAGDPLTSVSLTSTGTLSSIRQVRISVPEPAFGTAGLAALALLAKRRR